MGTNTLEFLYKLKKTNIYWYLTLTRIAPKGAKLVKETIQMANKWCFDDKLDVSNVNAFEICKAINSGQIQQDDWVMIEDENFQAFRDSVISRINIEQALMRKL